MRRISSIIISVTTLVLLAFGAGGLGLTKCACSGRTALLTLDDGGCCPDEGGCMTVTVVSMPDSDVPDQCCNTPMLEYVDVPAFSLVQSSIPIFKNSIIPTPVYSPPRFTLTTVLRV